MRIENMGGIIYQELSYQLNGVLFDVQNKLGTKFQEKHYVKAVCAFLKSKSISYVAEASLHVVIDGVVIGDFRADLVVDNKIVIEFKATDRLTKDHKIQLLRYLEALNLRLGLLVNFRVRPLQIWRVTN
ncbi:MAG: GxxExxY protein [Candidatus Magasanikbacteria bacterium]|nr:GxxExxY protein [Candidatus Magasanikbacteria bacterium]